VALEELIPAAHVYCHLDRVLALASVRDRVQVRYAAGIGPPHVDLEVFVRLQLVMVVEGTGSEHQLLRLAADQLSIQCYLGVNRNEPSPDQSSLTRIRARYRVAVIHRFFDVILEQCRQADLVWSRKIYLDSTQVQGNAALGSLTPRFTVGALRQRSEQAISGTTPALLGLFSLVTLLAQQPMISRTVSLP
jgi:hypothetical protein